MNLYINLGELMNKKGISAVKLSALTGLTPEHISKIKNGKTKKIELSTIDKLIQQLNVEPNDLFKYK